MPILLSVAGWDTEATPRVQDWLRLAQDYPAVCATALGTTAPVVLTENGQVLPVLDGLDELPPAAQATVITALNRCLSSTDQLIMTARTLEYRHAVDVAGHVLTSALVIEPDPLDPLAVADHPRSWASSTMCTMRASEESEARAVAATAIAPSPLIVLACTASPGPASTGTDSPVIADRSRLVWPVRMIPSVAVVLQAFGDREEHAEHCGLGDLS